MCLREDLLGRGRVEREVAGVELQSVVGGPQPRQMGLFRPACGDQLRTVGDSRDHHAQHVVTGR